MFLDSTFPVHKWICTDELLLEGTVHWHELIVTFGKCCCLIRPAPASEMMKPLIPLHFLSQDIERTWLKFSTRSIDINPSHSLKMLSSLCRSRYTLDVLLHVLGADFYWHSHSRHKKQFWSSNDRFIAFCSSSVCLCVFFYYNFFFLSEELKIFHLDWENSLAR